MKQTVYLRWPGETKPKGEKTGQAAENWRAQLPREPRGESNPQLCWEGLKPLAVATRRHSRDYSVLNTAVTNAKTREGNPAKKGCDQNYLCSCYLSESHKCRLKRAMAFLTWPFRGTGEDKRQKDPALRSLSWAVCLPAWARALARPCWSLGLQTAGSQSRAHSSHTTPANSWASHTSTLALSPKLSLSSN